MNGVNVFAQNLVQGLTHRGHVASIVLTNPDQVESIPMPVSEGIELVRLPSRHSDPPLHRWRALTKFLESRQPCIYIPNYDWHTSCVSPRLARQVGIIGIVHSDDPRHYEHFHRLGRTWNAVVAVSTAIGNQIVAIDPSVRSRMTVIPIGVHLPPRKAAPIPGANTLRVIYSGLLNQFQKRILDAAKIVRVAHERGVKISLTFAGGGDDEKLVRQACEDLVAQGIVRFAGILDRIQLARELDRHDVFLMTSEFEGLPNALLEGMAHSLVPIVTDIASGIPEVVCDGENGFIVPVGDISAFVDRMQTLHRDRHELNRMAAKARATVENGPYQVDRMVEAYQDVINRVADEAEHGTFERPRGPISPPSDLGPLWRQYIPRPVRRLWRRLRGLVSHA